ncbi:hypothetical protein SAMN04489860_0802 [Paraoerskovia marina]|uniref:Uncharacterized protein n=1 Tax=Paraoerskovia marina TaxID=545619 RepID=A0A1H1PGV2_9CELL|nr:hypothetical protein [Paraoerskovia marina]SDS10374.1 hypothetical protein SAMN04489860_0802 [Paraoerskovia marina]
MIATRWALWAAGAAMIAWGLWTAWVRVPPDQWVSVLLWLAGGIVVHDAVLAPVAILLGLVVLPRVPETWRPALRGGLLALGVLALLGVGVFMGAEGRRNPSVVPQDPLAAVLVALAVVVVGVVIGGLVTTRRRARAVGAA